MKKVILTVSAFIFSLKLMAQAPEKMSYQAVVRNSSNGLVISAPVGMRISILQGSAAGASVYTETQTVNSNANGLVSLEIGSGTVVSGNFSTIDWSADTYFIQTETDPTGGTTYTVTGTSQLMSVPYALHAKSAETVINNDDADADPTNELQNWTNLPGIPTDIADGDDVDDADADPANEIELPVGGNNAQVLSTDGTGNYSWVDQTVNTLPDGTVAGQTAYWNGTAWVVNTNIFNNGGNIGIGTTTPTTAKVVIGGTSGATGLDLSTADQYANMRVLRNPSGDNDMYIGLGSGATGADVKLYGNNVERMTINSGVGIGTTTPTQPLDVVGNVKFSGALMPNNTAGTTGQILTSAGAGTAPTWTTPATVNTLYTANGTLAGNRVVTQGANTLSFTGSAVNAFSVDGTTMSVDASNNRVGIGTATPLTNLDVAGNMGATNSLLIRNGNDISSNQSTQIAFGYSNSDQYKHYISTRHNAGGTVNNAIEFFTSDGTANGSIATATPCMSLNGGRVGIGTNSPTQILDVVGNMKFSGALMPNNTAGTTGQVLTSAGAGAAPTWTTPATVSTLYSADGSLAGNRVVTQGANTLGFTSTAVNGFSVDGTTMSVDAANNRVGVGTATPRARLDVNGEAFIQSTQFKTTNSSATNTLNLGTGSWGAMVIANFHTSCVDNGVGAILMIRNNGNVSVIGQGNYGAGGTISTAGNVLTITTTCGTTHTYTFNVAAGVATITHGGTGTFTAANWEVMGF